MEYCIRNFQTGMFYYLYLFLASYEDTISRISLYIVQQHISLCLTISITWIHFRNSTKNLNDLSIVGHIKRSTAFLIVVNIFLYTKVRNFSSTYIYPHDSAIMGDSLPSITFLETLHKQKVNMFI